MPSNSKSQYRFWRMAAKDKEFAAKRGISQAQAKEWHEADKKKREEDPEWWENLPDKVEKKGDKGNDPEESFEGFLDGLKSILGTKPTTPQKDMSHWVGEIKMDHSQLTEDKLNGKMVTIGAIGHLLQFQHWPHGSWLSDVEKNVRDFGQWARNYLTERGKLLKELHEIYKKAQEMDDIHEALRFVDSQVAKAEMKFDEWAFHHAARFGNFRYRTDSPFNGHRALASTGNGGGWPASIPAISFAEARKIVALMIDIDALNDHLYDITEDDWCLDDTDDYRRWIRKFPHDDETIAHVLSKFPIAGEYRGMEINESRILNDMEKGLAEILMRSLKH